MRGKKKEKKSRGINTLKRNGKKKNKRKKEEKSTVGNSNQEKL